MFSLLIAAVALFSTVATAEEKEGKPSGTVTVESKSVAVGIGVSWGDGVLTYKGKQYKFSMSGLSVVDVGVSKVTAKGKVFHLKKLEDFSGNYVAAAAGATVGGGAGGTAMKNQNGVVMKLTETSKGLQFTLAAEGVDIKLK
jgi:hypothetical protein